MSIKSQQANMKAIYDLVSQDLSYIYGSKESGPNGAKADFHKKSKAFLRALGNDLGFKEFKVTNNYGGIAVSGEITLKGIWSENNGLYFQLSQDTAARPKFLYSHISNMKDSNRGMNQWMDCELFIDKDYESVIDLLLALRNSADIKTEKVNRYVA